MNGLAFAAIVESALERAHPIRKPREAATQLNIALASSREISMAIGLLMMRDRLNREQVFDLLRDNARSQRRPVAEVEKELLNSAENPEHNQEGERANAAQEAIGYMTLEEPSPLARTLTENGNLTMWPQGEI